MVKLMLNYFKFCLYIFVIICIYQYTDMEDHNEDQLKPVLCVVHICFPALLAFNLGIFASKGIPGSDGAGVPKNTM